MLQFLAALSDGVHDPLAQLLGGIQQGVRGLALPLLHPAVEGIGLQVQLRHGLAGGDLPVLPALQDLIEHFLIHLDGLAALGGGVLS